jgi:hypothetical protein
MVLHNVTHINYYIHLYNCSSKVPVQGVARYYTVDARSLHKVKCNEEDVTVLWALLQQTHFALTGFTVSLLWVC